MYISLVESPATLSHEDNLPVTVWRRSFTRQRFYLSKLMLASTVFSAGQYTMFPSL